MERRNFITLLVGAAAAWPVTARGQPATKMPTIGYLGANAAVFEPWTAAFVARLRELDWIEGRTVAIDYRWSEGRPEREAEIAAEFVDLKVSVIAANGTAVAALKKATSIIPIVFTIANDPVGTGLVDSLARPGGNVTGMTLLTPDLAGKRLELLREMVPQLRRLAVMANVAYSAGVREIDDAQAAARTLGIETTPFEIRRAEDIAPAFEALKTQADALYIVQDSLVAANRPLFITLALEARMPTSFTTREFPQAGALMSYGPDIPDLFRRSAEVVDKILRGAKPGDIPVEQPTKFELAINLKTAKLLGLAVPPMLLATADNVFE